MAQVDGCPRFFTRSALRHATSYIASRGSARTATPPCLLSPARSLTAGAALALARLVPSRSSDMSELQLHKGVKIDFVHGEKELMKWKLVISPDDGIYKGGTFVFDVKIPDTYPHDPPKILCETTIFHPNIDMEGHVCLNILREDWKPVLTMSSVIMGMQFLMLEPNADDPLNKEAAAMLASDKDNFKRTVRHTFDGRSMTVAGRRYDFPRFT